MGEGWYYCASGKGVDNELNRRIQGTMRNQQSQDEGESPRAVQVVLG